MSEVPAVAVNARFVTQDLTGVQRYAHELVSRLAATSGMRVLLLVPPNEIVELAPGDQTPLVPDERWWGLGGHRWEQTTLRPLFRRSGARVLLSPAGWGPVTVRGQLPVIHDIHPILHPEFFARDYVRWSRVATPLLVRVARRVVATSGRVRDQLVRHLRVRPDRIDMVSPAVGPPFTDYPLHDLDARPGDHCLFVGGDKTQKNLTFLTEFWPEVHRELGLELWVTERAVPSRVMADLGKVPGVVRLRDPTDSELVEAYAGALCLLWPSIAEGFGIPLLEAMAVGTPFLSSDVGAAGDLAILKEQVLPLEPHLWIDQLRRWRCENLGDLRRLGAERARQATWERSAEALASALRPFMSSSL